MKIVFGVRDLSEARLRYAKQLGADGVSCSATVMPTYAASAQATADEFSQMRERVESFGLEVLAVRLRPRHTAQILQGAPGRDEEIDQICATIRAGGQAGIPTIFYNLTMWRSWEAPWPQATGVPQPGPSDVLLGSGPGRRYRAVGRGDAVLLTHTSALAGQDAADAPEAVNAPCGQVSSDEMWDRIGYFYERMVPVAEEAGVNVGSHPDDPPEKVYRGVEQVLNTADGLKRLIELVPSPRSGLLLCIGTLHEMRQGTMETLEYFLQRQKILSVHFRNPSGTVPGGYYQEDFLDEGDLDMLAVMRLFQRYQYRGLLDPDHAIGVEGDPDGRIAFAWELGYMRALRAAAQASAT